MGSTRNFALKTTWTLGRLLGRRLPRLQQELMGKLWFTPWEPKLSERARSRQRAWMDSAAVVRLRVGGKRVTTYKAGEGPAVMLLHGWGDSAAAMGAFISPFVTAGHQVIAFDFPAHGASGGRRTNFYATADVLEAVIDANGGAIYGLVAHSGGGHVAMVAMNRGIRPRVAALLAPSVDIRHSLDRFVELYGLNDNARQAIVAYIERRFGKAVWDELFGPSLVRGIDIPTLLVHDRFDEQVPFSDAELLRDAWPAARLHAIENVGHARMVRDPAVVRTVVDFVSGGGSTPQPGGASAAEVRGGAR